MHNFYLYVYLICLDVLFLWTSALHACLVPVEVRREPLEVELQVLYRAANGLRVLS